MKQMDNHILPIATFKAKAKKMLAYVNAYPEQPIYITQKGKGAAVVISVEHYHALSALLHDPAIQPSPNSIPNAEVMRRMRAQVVAKSVAERAASKKTVKRAVAAKRARRK